MLHFDWTTKRGQFITNGMAINWNVLKCGRGALVKFIGLRLATVLTGSLFGTVMMRTVPRVAAQLVTGSIPGYLKTPGGRSSLVWEMDVNGIPLNYLGWRMNSV